MLPTRLPPSVDVCIPVWNRGELLSPCVTSLRRQLGGVDATIWLFDNGSDAETRAVIRDLAEDDPHTFSVRFPRNMGIPHAVNMFVQSALQECDIAGRRRPDYLLLLDSDAYFRRPIRQLIEILESDYRFGAVSGHRSVEHEPIARRHLVTPSGVVEIDEKQIERMFCLLLRSEDLAAMVPFPHDTHVDVDWQIAERNPHSLKSTGRVIAATDNAVHIGLYDSTWHPVGVPASAAEAVEIDAVLHSLGLMTSERRARAAAYRAATRLPAARLDLPGASFRQALRP